MKLQHFIDDPFWWFANRLFKSLKRVGLGAPQYHLYNFYSKLRLSRSALRSYFDDNSFGRSPVYTDLYYLYHWVKKNKPDVVLEIGSGCSTIAIAQALFENAQGHLYSYDHSRRWSKETLDQLPVDLRHYCTIAHAPIGIVKVDKVPRIFHEDIPSNMGADLIYLDSPPTSGSGETNSLFDELDRYGNPRVMVDPLLQENVGHFTLIVDGKKVTAHFLGQKMKDQYVVRQHIGFSRTVFIPRTS